MPAITLTADHRKTLRTARQSQGLSISALAAMLDKSQPYISCLEAGTKKPSAEFLALWADAVGFRASVETRVRLVRV